MTSRCRFTGGMGRRALAMVGVLQALTMAPGCGESSPTPAPIDPIRVAHRLDPERTWLYTAMFDQVVPAENGAALGKAAGLDQNHHSWLPGGHYTAALFIPRILADILARMRPQVDQTPPGK